MSTEWITQTRRYGGAALARFLGTPSEASRGAGGSSEQAALAGTSRRRLLDSFSGSGRGDVRPSVLLLLGLQVGLVLLVMHVYQVEALFGFLRLTPLVIGGFLVHALLPLQWRLPFFVALSLGAIAVVLGVKQGAGLIVLGLALIGTCHLPVPFRVRVGLLVAAGAALAAVRGGWVETGWQSLPTLVVPVLGAMFMFRLAVYLYDLRHEREAGREPATLSERLAYFFMLPNVCFLLFPVVDYQTFRRTYYDGNAATTYQKGVLWMYRGVVHLLLYRLVYYHFVPDPAAVVGLGGVVQTMVTTYLLYLRISGQFHLIIGIMCLFGFNLPETHHLYFLASSFTDYWRRINIYWKDFMMKLFYYPAFMRLRAHGTTTALVGATLIVFAGTWLLHSYQWFWLQGTFPVTGPDVLFWGILGGLVVINALREAKRGRKRVAGTKGWDVRAATVLSLKTVGMFAFITVLWSLWSSPTVGEWVSLVAQAGQSGPGAFALLALGLAALVGAGVALQYAVSRGWTFTATGSHPSFARSATVTSLGAVALLALGLPEVQTQLGERTAEVVASVQSERLNQHDEDSMERGYYEGLLNAESYTSALARSQSLIPEDWEKSLQQLGAAEEVGGWLQNELVPSQAVIFKQAQFRTNRFGMRDREYDQEKPPNTYRVALLGSSHGMGWGVSDEEIFEVMVEERLNQAHLGGAFDQYEILNFSFQGYGVLQNVMVLETKALPFAPDAVYLVVHPNEVKWTVSQLVTRLERGVEIPYPDLAAIVQRAGVEPGAKAASMRRDLHRAVDELIGWGYQRIVAACEERGILPVWVFLPRPQDSDYDEMAESLRYLSGLAEKAGFVTLDLDGVYEGHAAASLYLAPWDKHPNAFAHQLIADRMYEALVAHDADLGLGLSSTPSPTVVTHQDIELR